MQLVEAAFRRVAEVGFEGLRLRQVAGEVGIDHSTLHHHFATKQDLIDAVTEFTARQFWNARPAGADPVAALRGHLAMLRRMIDERPELLVVTAELDLRARRDQAIAAQLRREEAGWRSVLTQLFADGNASGAWQVDPAGCCELVIAAVKGVRLVPELAEQVFGQLETLLLGGR